MQRVQHEVLPDCRMRQRKRSQAWKCAGQQSTRDTRPDVHVRQGKFIEMRKVGTRDESRRDVAILERERAHIATLRQDAFECNVVRLSACDSELLQLSR